ncbi:hypothetical protein [Streptomyces sp. NPDC001404]|uniref:hypothetical protein n=1 Tax=Streptomyces sp. NPDC001404 TaxID=3364571 RepID=UPI0036D05105
MMALYGVSQGGIVNAGDITQVVNLLNGTDTSTQVTVANRIASATNGVSSGGFVGTTAATGGAPTSTTGLAYASGDFSSDGSAKPGLWVNGGGTFYPIKAQRKAVLARAAAFAMSGGSYANVYWDTSVYQTDAGIWSSSSASNINITTPGLWRISAWWDPDNSGGAARIALTCSALGLTNQALGYSLGYGNVPASGVVELAFTAATLLHISCWTTTAMNSTAFPPMSLGVAIELIG